VGNTIKDLLVRILVDDGEVQKFEKAGTKVKGFGDILDKGAIASAGALALLAGGAIEAGKAAAGAEQSQEALQFALDKFPATADTNAEKLGKLNEELALKTKFDDDAYASGEAILAQYGLTGKQIEQLTPLLGDYAAKTGTDLPTAAGALGKALLGQGRALKSVGINFKDTHDLGKNYDQLLGGLTDKVGGFADAQGKTAAGSSAILGNSIDDLMKKLGKGLLPTMVHLTQTGIGVMTWMQKNTGVVIPLAFGVGSLAGAVLLANGVVKAFALGQAVANLVTGEGTIAVIAHGVATKAVAIAQGTATAAQWLLNAAMDANPIGIIVVAIGALVAGLIWFFTQTKLGKEIWSDFTRFLGEAWKNVVGAFKAAVQWVVDAFTNFQLGLKIIGDGIAKWWNGLWAGVGAAFRSFYTGWIQPVVNAIGAALGFLYHTFIEPIVKLILIEVGLLVAGFEWLWSNAIQPALNAIGVGMRWLYDNAIKPVIDAITAVWKWLYDNVFAPIGLGIQLEIQAIGQVFTWLYNNVFAPIGLGIQLAIAAVGAAFQWVHDNVIAPVGQFIQTEVTDVGLAFQLVNEKVIQPSIQAIGAGFQWVWTNVILPVSNFIQAAIQTIGTVISTVFGAIGTSIRAGFDGVVDFIRGIVNGIIDGINHVIDGINGAAKIAGKALGMDLTLGHIPRLASGGIALGPQLAVVGDNAGGREAIIPLDSPVARQMMGGNDGPTDLSDRTIDKLARALAAIQRVTSRQGVTP
jgi:hypothetical protein